MLAGRLPVLPLMAASYAAGTVAAATLGGPWWATAIAAALAATVVLALAAREEIDVASVLALLAAVAIAGAGHARFADAHVLGVAARAARGQRTARGRRRRP